MRCVSMVINSSSIMSEESVKASIVRLEGIVAVPKMPLAYGVCFVPDFFQIFWKKLFFCTHSDWIFKRNRIRSESVSKSVTTGEELSTGRTASITAFSKSSYSQTGDRSLWRNRLARSTVNRKVGGSSPPRDAFLVQMVRKRLKFFNF